MFVCRMFATVVLMDCVCIPRLPYHGGPGNNYTMHGIAAMVKRLRAHPGDFGFVTANGG